jgi:hypothetical protein
LDNALPVQGLICYGDATGFTVIDVVYNYNGDYENISYIWSPNLFGENGIRADSNWSLTAGDYTLTINDENGCSRVFDFTINQTDSLFLSVFGSELAHCL